MTDENTENEIVRCPLWDGFSAQVLERTEVGVMFWCPQHQEQEILYKDMDHGQALELKVPYETWKAHQPPLPHLSGGTAVSLERTNDPEVMCGCECGCNVKVARRPDGSRGRGCMGLCDLCAGVVDVDVVCDKSNNTEEDVQAGRLNVTLRARADSPAAKRLRGEQ